MTEVHPAKVEIFDIASGVNRDPKGIVRTVDEYRQTPFGLYIARPTPGRKQFHYVESWILPSLGLRVTDFWFSPGYEKNQDFYLDIVSVTTSPDSWEVTDLYLDLVLLNRTSLRVIDTDELIAALGAGLITDKQAQYALERTYDTLLRLTEHRYDLAAWLATYDMTLTWRRH